jgi:hypothetical protein
MMKPAPAQPISPPARAPSALSPAQTPAGAATPAPANAPAGSERRKSPRYNCQGSIQLREINGLAATWATFTDISLHGCYVEAATSYSIGTVLAMTIDVNGFRIEATGEVRASYPSLGMGISFTKLSDKDRGQLRELTRSISPPSMIMSTPRSPSIPRAESAPAVINAAPVLQAIQKFFENRHVMGREEFLAILRKNQ